MWPIVVVILGSISKFKSLKFILFKCWDIWNIGILNSIQDILKKSCIVRQFDCTSCFFIENSIFLFFMLEFAEEWSIFDGARGQQLYQSIILLVALKNNLYTNSLKISFQLNFSSKRRAVVPVWFFMICRLSEDCSTTKALGNIFTPSLYLR